MIIICENCNKKFELNESLVPDTGRLLECGSCSHQWHYMAKNRINDINNEEISHDLIKETKNIKEKKLNPLISANNQKDIKIIQKKNLAYISKKKIIKKERIGLISLLLVIIFTSIAVIVLIDTFKIQINFILPNIDFHLSNLYESLKDIYLFLKDLT